MKKVNFLIVDDIIMNRILLKEVISDICGEIKEASNGKEALGILTNDDIDIILMDIEMPIMNGVETTQYIRSELPPPLNKIPIIALTAHNPSDFFDSYSKAGFDHLLTKPYSFEKILNTINLFFK